MDLIKTNPKDARTDGRERAGCSRALVVLLCLIATELASAQSVVAWGWNASGQCNVPVLPSGLTFVEVAAGLQHTVTRRTDGSVVAWGLNNFGQCTVPALPAGLTYVEVAAGGIHTVARRSDGSVVAWGYNVYGQCSVPALPSGLAYVEVGAGYVYTVARRTDGSVVAWGDNSAGQCNAPVLPGGLTYVEIAAGGSHTVSRRSDGSVVAWGDNTYGQCNIPALPVGLAYVEIAAGYSHTVARRGDGSVVAWGYNAQGQCNVPPPPGGLSYVEIAAGSYHTVARCDFAAAVVPAGAGCGGTGMPVLAANAPRIGQTINLALTQATPSASGFLYFSGVPASPLPLGSGCIVEVDLATVSPLFPVTATATGTWAFTVGLPMDPSLVGVQVALQIALFNTAGPLGFDLSNGLIATIGY